MVTVDFYRDVNDIAQKAIKAYGLSHNPNHISKLDEPLLRWIDFTLRYIPEKMESSKI